MLTVNATVIEEKKNKDKENQLSFSIKEVIGGQSSDTFCPTPIKLINGGVVSGKYFISNDWLLHKVVKEDDKLF